MEGDPSSFWRCQPPHPKREPRFDLPTRGRLSGSKNFFSHLPLVGRSKSEAIRVGAPQPAQATKKSPPDTSGRARKERKGRGAPNPTHAIHA